MKLLLDVHGKNEKCVKTGSKISNNDIRINLKIVETIFWH